MRVRCKACGGVYVAVLPDGMEYYHACPPETLVTVRRDAGTREVLLADVQPTDTEISRRTRERADARDENVVVVSREPGKERFGIKREGRGVEAAP